MASKDEQKSVSEKNCHIPMEVTSDSIKELDIDPEKVEWARIGNRRVRVIMVPSTKEQYDAYMRPEWNEDKYQQRHGKRMSSLDSLLSDYGLEPVDSSSSVEGEVMKREFLRILRAFLSKLEEIDRTIVLMHFDHKSEREIAPVVGMSQRGVGKRKKRLLEELQDVLKDFKNTSFF